MVTRQFFYYTTPTQEIIYIPYWGLGVCVLFYIRTQRRISCISLLGDPDILSVLVCLASVCIMYPKTVFYCS